MGRGMVPVLHTCRMWGGGGAEIAGWPSFSMGSTWGNLFFRCEIFFLHALKSRKSANI